MCLTTYHRIVFHSMKIRVDFVGQARLCGLGIDYVG